MESARDHTKKRHDEGPDRRLRARQSHHQDGEPPSECRDDSAGTAPEIRRSGLRPPVVPSVAVELLHLTRRANVGVHDVTRLLERDQFLASEMLRLAQSATYGITVPVRSLDEAIARVGMRRSGHIFMRAALESRAFKARGYEEHVERLRAHSVATAELARLICRETALCDDYAYLCGLLHDVGIAACLIVLGSETLGTPPPFEEAWPALRLIHVQTTQQLAGLWRLPDDMRVILEHHHVVGRVERLHPWPP